MSTEELAPPQRKIHTEQIKKKYFDEQVKIKDSQKYVVKTHKGIEIRDGTHSAGKADDQEEQDLNEIIANKNQTDDERVEGFSSQDDSPKQNSKSDTKINAQKTSLD